MSGCGPSRPARCFPACPARRPTSSSARCFTGCLVRCSTDCGPKRSTDCRPSCSPRSFPDCSLRCLPGCCPRCPASRSPSNSVRSPARSGSGNGSLRPLLFRFPYVLDACSGAFVSGFGSDEAKPPGLPNPGDPFGSEGRYPYSYSRHGHLRFAGLAKTLDPGH